MKSSKLIVGIIRPPQIGHMVRGTGVYTTSLVQELQKTKNIQVFYDVFNNLKNKVDLYHFPYFDPFFLTLPIYRSKPTILTIHDLIPIRFTQQFPRGVKGEIKWQVQKYLAGQVDAIITDSLSSKNDIAQFIKISNEKIFPIYLAPNNVFYLNSSEEEKKEISKKYKLPDKFILFVGDGSWNKNLVAVSQVAKMTKLPFVIVSKSLNVNDQILKHPTNTSLASAYAIFKSLSNVSILSNVDTKDLVKLYQLASLLLFPSHYEGFGLPVVEAFASGCPVITTKAGSLSEIIDDAAITVNPNNIEEIASSVQKLFENKSLRDTLSRKGRKRAKDFTWSKTCAETVKVYFNFAK